jgi:predicted SPOUT superfamily RNA methylase MTH1
MAVNGKLNVRNKSVINNNIIEPVNNTNYWGYTITVRNNKDFETKMNRFNQRCSTIRTQDNKASKETQIKLYKAMAVLTFTCRSEI